MGLVDVWEYQFIVGVEDIVWCFAALLAFCIFAVGLERMIRAPYVSDVQEKHILITGCDTGFGRAAALKISRLGCTVFAGCLTEKGQRDLQEEAAGEGRKVITLKMDVTNDSSIERALKEVEKQLPKNTGYITHCSQPCNLNSYRAKTNDLILHPLEVVSLPRPTTSRG